MPALCSALDAALGDFFDESNPCGLLALNRQFDDRRFPRAVEQAVLEAGFAEHTVPASRGGMLRDPWELFSLTRAVSQRSMTPVIKYGSSLLAANPVWLWGTEAQQEAVAAHLLKGEVACFGISERDAGSDLRATATRYASDGDEVQIHGEKWPVGNAARAAFYTVLARSPEDRLSLLLVHGRGDAVRPGEQVECLGLWGHDLGGVVFDGPARASLIGKDGVGVVYVLKTLQVTRTIMAGLALGGLDAALAIAVRYASERPLYGAPVLQIPEVRQEIVGATLDSVLAEVFTFICLRALVIRPQSLALWSSIAKVAAPTIAEHGIRAAQRVLGARSFTANDFSRRLHQIATENAITGIFEGTTHVNIRNVLAQSAVEPAESDDAELVDLCSLDAAPATWAPAGPDLRMTHLGDDPIASYLLNGLRSGSLPIAVTPDEARGLRRRLEAPAQGANTVAAGYAVVWAHLFGAVCAFLVVNESRLTSSQQVLLEQAGRRALEHLGLRDDGAAAGEVVDIVLRHHVEHRSFVSVVDNKD